MEKIANILEVDVRELLVSKFECKKLRKNKVITVDRYRKVNLKNYAFNIGDVSVFMDLYRMDIGENNDQQIVQYDLILERGTQMLSNKNQNLTSKIVDIKHIEAIATFWNNINGSITITKIDIAFPILPNVTLKVFGEYEPPDYHIYLNGAKDDYDYISRNDKDVMQIHLRESTFQSLLHIAPNINNYCQQLIINN